MLICASTSPIFFHGFITRCHLVGALSLQVMTRASQKDSWASDIERTLPVFILGDRWEIVLLL
jgi:hypothetical protein